MAKRFKDILAKLPEDQQQRIALRTNELIFEVVLQQLAEKIDLSEDEQSKISKLVSKQERQSDMQISTLCQIIRAMGGTLKVTASIPGKGEFELKQFGDCGQ